MQKIFILLITLLISQKLYAATPEEKVQLITEAWQIGNIVSDRSYDDALKKIATLEGRYNKDKDPAVIEILNKLSLQKAYIFIERKKFKEAGDIIINVQKKTTITASPAPYVAIRSYFLQAIIGKRTNKGLEAFQAFDTIAKLYAKFSVEPVAAWMVAIALADAGYTYEMTGDLKTARVYFEEVVRAFRDSQQVEIILALETASFRLTYLDFMASPGEGSLASQNRYLSKFDVPPGDDFEDHIAIVLYGKSLSLGLLKRSKETKAVLEEWISRFGNRTEKPFTDYQTEARNTLAKLR